MTTPTDSDWQPVRVALTLVTLAVPTVGHWLLACYRLRVVRREADAGRGGPGACSEDRGIVSKPTYLSYFAGGDLCGVGLQAAGYAPDTLVELDPAIAEVAAANHPDARVLVADVTTVDPRRFDRPALLWVSPPCTNASRANPARGETARDLALADAICLALRTLTPPTFCLENVREYRAFISFGRIVACLSDLGYQYTIAHVNSADIGVPQTRIRLILRAVRGGLVPHLPAPVPWQGWYGAIADLIPTLPESRFAPWQLARLDRLTDHTLASDQRSNTGQAVGTRAGGLPSLTVDTRPAHKIRAFLVGGGNTQLSQVDSWPRGGGEPAFTVPAGNGGTSNMRALLVSGQNAGQEWGKGCKEADEPAMTVAAAFGERPAHMPRAFIVHPTDQRTMPVREAAEPVWTLTAGANATRNPDMRPRAWLDEGRVVKMHPRALARFQSCPDSYILPEKAGLATLVLGNGVPCLMAQRIGEAFLRGGQALAGAAVSTGAGAGR